MTAPDRTEKSFPCACLSLTSTRGLLTGGGGDAFLGAVGVQNNESGSETERCSRGDGAPGTEETGRASTKHRVGEGCLCVEKF